VSASPGTPLPVWDDPPRRSRWSSLTRITFELVLLFAVAVLAKHILAATMSGSYPNPLWLPVIVLSLQYGMAAGLGAALAAAVVQYSDGLPPALMSEDMYGYIGRVAAEPVGWTCVALLIGHIRSRQIANVAELEAELAERNRQCAAVADLCADLRDRAEMLERQIAANAQASSVDVAVAITELNLATWDDFSQRLTRFVVLMTGAADFAVYLLRDNELKAALRPNDEYRNAADTEVPPDHPLFTAIVNARRVLSAARPADAALLGNRWTLAGPLLDGHDCDRAIGMFAIAGAALDDLPDDIERRFSLTATEIARLVGRIVLIDDWHAATSPDQSNGHKPPGPAPRAGGPDDAPASEANGQRGEPLVRAPDTRPEPGSSAHAALASEASGLQ
jgi:GAF domain